jgi:hypothetical protein
LRLFLTEVIAICAVGLAIVLLVTSYGLAGVIGSSIAGLEPSRYCHDRDLTPLGSAAVRGQAWLCFSGEGIDVSIVPEHLVPGRAYTAWLLYANDPRGCNATPCEGSGPGEEHGHWIRARVDGAIADDRRTVRLAATYRGLRLAQGAQVLLVLVDAGETGDTPGLAHAQTLLLPPPTLMEGATAKLSAAAPDLDSTRGVVVSRALFTVLRNDD